MNCSDTEEIQPLTFSVVSASGERCTISLSNKFDPHAEEEVQGQICEELHIPPTRQHFFDPNNRKWYNFLVVAYVSDGAVISLASHGAPHSIEPIMEGLLINHHGLVRHEIEGNADLWSPFDTQRMMYESRKIPILTAGDDRMIELLIGAGSPTHCMGTSILATKNPTLERMTLFLEAGDCDLDVIDRSNVFNFDSELIQMLIEAKKVPFSTMDHLNRLVLYRSGIQSIMMCDKLSQNSLTLLFNLVS